MSKELETVLNNVERELITLRTDLDIQQRIIGDLRADLEAQRNLTEHAISNVNVNRAEVKELRTDVQTLGKTVSEAMHRQVTRDELEDIFQKHLETSFNAQIVSGLKRLIFLTVGAAFTVLTAWVLSALHLSK